MFSTLPHTPEDIEAMLSTIGVRSLEELFADVPAELLLTRPLAIPPGATEPEVMRRLGTLAAANRTGAVSFLGCGSYDHLIPSVVEHLVSRSEFSTAYTPYQAEMSQGMLQAIFEYQTMIAELCALDVSNASLYDGHTAVCEAAAMALAAARKSRTILTSATLHPHTRQLLRTHFSSLDVELVEVRSRDGVTDQEDLGSKLGEGVAAVILQSPNVLGYLEDYGAASEAVHACGALLVVSVNPVSLGVLQPPGEWGADIAVGDGQPLGIAQCFGGPSVGFIAAREGLLRRLPGRLVGESVDLEGRRAYLLTLQAREQHIKRERATSNICSNQALMALAVTVHLSALGPQGLREVGELCMRKAHYLEERLVRELGLEPCSSAPFFNEFSVRLPRPPSEVLERMEQEGVLAGVDLGLLEPGRHAGVLTVAVTEKRTREELDRYVELMGRALA